MFCEILIKGLTQIGQFCHLYADPMGFVGELLLDFLWLADIKMKLWEEQR